MGGVSSAELHQEFAKPVLADSASTRGGPASAHIQRLAQNDVLVARDYADRSCANPFAACVSTRPKTASLRADILDVEPIADVTSLHGQPWVCVTVLGAKFESVSLQSGHGAYVVVAPVRTGATLPDLEDSVKTPVAFGGAARAKQSGLAKNQDKQTVWNTRFHFVTTREKIPAQIDFWLWTVAPQSAEAASDAAPGAAGSSPSVGTKLGQHSFTLDWAQADAPGAKTPMWLPVFDEEKKGVVAELLVHVTCARSLDVTLLRALHFSHVMQLELVGAQLEGGDKPISSSKSKSKSAVSSHSAWCEARVGMNHVRTAVSTDGDGDAPQWRWSGGLWLDHQWEENHAVQFQVYSSREGSLNVKGQLTGVAYLSVRDIMHQMSNAVGSPSGKENDDSHDTESFMLGKDGMVDAWIPLRSAGSTGALQNELTPPSPGNSTIIHTATAGATQMFKAAPYQVITTPRSYHDLPSAGMLHVRFRLHSRTALEDLALQQILRMLDSDADGSLTRLEYRTAIELLGLAPFVGEHEKVTSGAEDKEVISLFKSLEDDSEHVLSASLFYAGVRVLESSDLRYATAMLRFLTNAPQPVFHAMHAPPRRLESAGSERKLNGHRPSEVAEEEEELAELDDDQDQLESEKRFYFILRETGARHSTRRSYWEVLAHRLTATAKDAKANAVLLASIDRFYGELCEDSASGAELIRSFLSLFPEVKLDECERPLHEYPTFNEFFHRSWKGFPDEVRPVFAEQNEKVAVVPCDSTIVAYDSITTATRLWIKGKSFSLEALVGNDFAKKFKEGSVCVCHLAPSDAHRFVFPVSGTVATEKLIKGALLPTEPRALLSEHMSPLHENQHRIIEMFHPTWGEVCMVAVGSCAAGSVLSLVRPGDKAKRGDEAGYFAHGGSCVVVLFQKGSIQFDADLKQNTLSDTPTRVLARSSLGVCTASPIRRLDTLRSASKYVLQLARMEDELEQQR